MLGTRGAAQATGRFVPGYLDGQCHRSRALMNLKERGMLWLLKQIDDQVWEVSVTHTCYMLLNK